MRSARMKFAWLPSISALICAVTLQAATVETPFEFQLDAEYERPEKGTLTTAPVSLSVR